MVVPLTISKSVTNTSSFMFRIISDFVLQLWITAKIKVQTELVRSQIRSCNIVLPNSDATSFVFHRMYLEPDIIKIYHPIISVLPRISRENMQIMGDATQFSEWPTISQIGLINCVIFSLNVRVTGGGRRTHGLYFNTDHLAIVVIAIISKLSLAELTYGDAECPSKEDAEKSKLLVESYFPFDGVTWEVLEMNHAQNDPSNFKVLVCQSLSRCGNTVCYPHIHRFAQTGSNATNSTYSLMRRNRRNRE
ncbi:hypothetical protein CLF_108044 [Clonorchis sinensis]|uniref:Uncharacterized protein n=1 Tax=Clonorchis sinensis TaxID=79923 RepID=G7YR89_CLOSI|nr:hypothetical protein CLF_108044 [Clonorchis sinensis]